MHKLRAFITYYWEPGEQEINFIPVKFSFQTARKGKHNEKSTGLQYETVSSYGRH